MNRRLVNAQLRFNGILLPFACDVGASAGRMYHVQASKETLNEGILLIKGSAAGAAAAVKEINSRVADCFEREALLEFWLKVRHVATESLLKYICGAFLIRANRGSAPAMSRAMIFFYAYRSLLCFHCAVCGHGRGPTEADRHAGQVLRDPALRAEGRDEGMCTGWRCDCGGL
jgi:hypothetical protein